MLPLLPKGLCFREVRRFVPFPRRDSKRKNDLTMCPWPDGWLPIPRPPQHIANGALVYSNHGFALFLLSWTVRNVSVKKILLCNCSLSMDCSSCYTFPIRIVSCKCVVDKNHRVYCNIYCNVVFQLNNQTRFVQSSVSAANSKCCCPRKNLT